MNADDLLSSRDIIGSHVQSALERASEAWGTKIMRVEIQEIHFSSEIQETLTRAREAELIRRAKVVTAQEERDIDILQAEGQKQATMKIAEGNFEAAKLQAEADFLLASKKLEGEAKGIKAVAEAMRENPDAIVAIKTLEAQQKIAEHLGRSGNMMILPTETAGLVGAAGSIIKGLEFTRNGGFRQTQRSCESDT